MTTGSFEKKIEQIGFSIKGLIPFTRNSTFNGEPCEVCGSKELVYGEGRYIIFDDNSPVEIFFCGKCLQELVGKYNLDFM